MMRQFLIVMMTLGLLLAACGAQPGGTPPPPGVTEVTSAPVATAAPGLTEAATAESVASTAETTPQAQQETEGALVVMSHDSFNITESVLTTFEQQSGIDVQLLPSGDAGSALNKAILSKDAPLADVFFGVDNTFLSRALNADIFEPYPSPALEGVPDEFKLDPSSSLLPIDYGFVSINYDKAYLEQNNLQPPQTLEELTQPEWKSKLVVQNPATSSPGLAFLLATVSYFGAEGDYTWVDFWRDLRANDVLVTEGWEDAYYTQFSGSSGQGPRPLVVSYASSPPAEVLFSEGKLTEPPTGVVSVGSFRQIEFAGILKGTQRRPQAEQFIDFMLSKPFQEDMPLQMFVYPVLTDAALPELFTQFAVIPEEPQSLPPEQIEQNREEWIDEWTQVVLR
jgi:thiamine transport system substrate-binding protein